MRACLVSAALLLPTLASACDDRTDAEIVADARRGFQRGVENRTRLLLARRHFADAADNYLKLHERGVRSPALYRDLGNAATLADRWPLAIWAYHAGLWLDPNDAELRDHLAFVRAKVLYPSSGLGQPQPDFWPAWLHRPSVFDLIAIAAFSYVLTWILGTCAVVRPATRLYWLTATAMLIAVASGVGLWHTLEQREIDRATPLVIVAENTPFYRGNGTSYPQHAEVPILPRGMEARQLHRRGQWLMIRLTSGETGWVPLERVLVVEP